MPDKKESLQPAQESSSQAGGARLSSQESADFFNWLMQEFQRRAAPARTTLPPDVERDVAAVTAAIDSIDRALSFGRSPIAISNVSPGRGSAAGGTRVTICGSHLLPGATVFFGESAGTDVEAVSLTEIRVTTPRGPDGYGGDVDVVVSTLGGTASLAHGFTYQG